MGIRVVYLGSQYFSDQLSCRKYFDPSYCLKDIDVYCFNQFIIIFGIYLIILIQHYSNSVLISGTHLSYSNY